MINNIRILAATAFASLALLAVIHCAPVHGEPRIAVLMSHASAPYQAMLQGFQTYLRDSGQRADYVIQQIEDDIDSVTPLAEKIDQQDAALIYCLGTRACQAAQQLTPLRPIVASMILTPASMSPDAPATGVFLNYSPQTQLQRLKKLFPHIQRVGVIYNPEQNQTLIDQATGAARQLGLTLVAAAVDTPKALPAALKNLLRDVDILWALPDRIVLAPQSAREILLTSFRNRIPVIGASAPWVKSGALYALDWDFADMGAQNAAMALQITQGTPIDRMPMAEPRSVVYSLNLKTAKHMKLDVPAATIRSARHVYR